MKVLLFGGSFDPPHQAHMDMLRAAARRINPARVYVIPAYHSPLKESSVSSARDRYEMTRLAVASLPKKLRKRVIVDAYEVRRAKRSYTYQTLAQFKRRYPDGELYFLAGSDTYASFPRWKRPERIRRMATFVVGRRPGAKIPKPSSGYPKRALLPGRFPDLSSTEIRARLIAGEGTGGRIAGRVAGYIAERGLYGADIHERLKAELRPGRYAHTVAVARRARELAKHHGLGQEQAATAGLLHDCGRAVSAPRMAAYARRHKLRVAFLEETAARHPILLHAFISEDRARRVYNVRDPEVLSAIRKHTLGDPEMGPLDRLIYCADACSADRSFPEAKKIYKAARRSLADGLAEAVRVKLQFALEDEKWLHPTTAELWNRVVDEQS